MICDLFYSCVKKWETDFNLGCVFSGGRERRVRGNERWHHHGARLPRTLRTRHQCHPRGNRLERDRRRSVSTYQIPFFSKFYWFFFQNLFKSNYLPTVLIKNIHWWNIFDSDVKKNRNNWREKGVYFVFYLLHTIFLFSVQIQSDWVVHYLTLDCFSHTVGQKPLESHSIIHNLFAAGAKREKFSWGRLAERWKRIFQSAFYILHVMNADDAAAAFNLDGAGCFCILHNERREPTNTCAQSRKLISSGSLSALIKCARSKAKNTFFKAHYLQSAWAISLHRERFRFVQMEMT